MIREYDIRTGIVTERAPTAAEQAYIDAASAEWTAQEPARLAEATAFAQAVAQLRGTYNTPRTAAQINNSIDALTVVMRRLFRELQ